MAAAAAVAGVIDLVRRGDRVLDLDLVDLARVGGRPGEPAGQKLGLTAGDRGRRRRVRVDAAGAGEGRARQRQRGRGDAGDDYVAAGFGLKVDLRTKTVLLYLALRG